MKCKKSIKISSPRSARYRLAIISGFDQKIHDLISFDKLTPKIITEEVKWDSDDPAIWIHPDDPSKSLIIGTDKNVDGALYVFDLEGKIIEEKVVRREGTSENPHDHHLVKVVDVSTVSSDGSEVTSVALSEEYPEGLFVAMSDDKTFHYYSWSEIINK